MYWKCICKLTYWSSLLIFYALDIKYDIMFCIILWIHNNSDIYSRRFYAVGNWRSNYLIFNGFFLLPLCYYMWGIVVVVTAVTFIFLSALLFQVVFPNRLHLFIDVFFVSLQGSMALNSSFSNWLVMRFLYEVKIYIFPQNTDTISWKIIQIFGLPIGLCLVACV